MSPDRYSDSETPPTRCCRNGWLSADDADVAIPCPIHRPPRKTDINDFAERTPSARAQQAIQQAEENQK